MMALIAPLRGRRASPPPPPREIGGRDAPVRLPQGAGRGGVGGGRAKGELGGGGAAARSPEPAGALVALTRG